MAKKKLQLKKEFRKGRSTRHIEGFGRVIFDPEKVKESDYESYYKKGFDIFEDAGDAPRTRAEELDSGNNATAVKKMASDMGLEFDSKMKKRDVIDLIVANEEREAEDVGDEN